MRHPFENAQEYANIIDLYKRHLYGGGISVDDADYWVTIVRYEDLLHNPEGVVTNLQKLGLGRKRKRFEAAFHSQGI